MACSAPMSANPSTCTGWKGGIAAQHRDKLLAQMPTSTLHEGRHLLQIPGPTNVPDRVLRAMNRPTIDHRGPEFASLTLSILSRLRQVFRTSGPTVIFPSSGTGAWEAALVNTLSAGDSVLMYETGEFARLWRGVAERLGPTLHGLCTYGTVGHAQLRTLCAYAPSRLTGMQARFSAPVFAGEIIHTEIWRDGGAGKPVFRSRVVERNDIVLDQGAVEVQA